MNCLKFGYGTKHAALMARGKMRRDGRRGGRGQYKKLDAYKCEGCGQWHLGNSWTRDTRR